MGFAFCQATSSSTLGIMPAVLLRFQRLSDFGLAINRLLCSSSILSPDPNYSSFNGMFKLLLAFLTCMIPTSPGEVVICHTLEQKLGMCFGAVMRRVEALESVMPSP